ncbi:MAG: hypothetical protein FJ217_02905 [Ignavibacteria bacterium]|nr:hypothetical protein [Ignavibacteria bacterium]
MLHVSVRTPLRFRSLIALTVVLSLQLPAQQAQLPSHSPSRKSALFQLTAYDTLYKLPHGFILPSSELVLLDSTEALLRDKDYQVQYRDGTLVLTPSLRSRLATDTLHHLMSVSYYPLPLGLRREYTLREVIARKDSQGVERRFVTPSPRPFSIDDVIGPGLQKSGTIFRGFTVGSNRDMSLNSGFRMQLSGIIASDMNLVAALTDENSPIQPEGTTTTLQELDKIFVELSGSTYAVTLGDFNLQRTQKQGGEFGGLLRKLQGATGSLRSKNLLDAQTVGSFSLTGATARGKFATNQFQGIEGSQGPYRLSGREGSGRPVIIAGTERVYVNGEVMTRGETQDYTIDYASGEIFFSPRRLITNASRITVDFEYSDRNFTRNLVGASADGSALGGRIRFSAMLFQEADDPDAPIEFTFDDATRSLLKESGTDRLRASLPGERYVGRDSLTGAPKGQYVRRDTTIGGRQLTVFVFAPGDPQAAYAVTFSYVDRVPSDSAGYVRSAVGRFQFAGIGNGNYMPVQFIPIPELHRLFSGAASADVISDLDLSFEYALSTFDRNRLSTRDDDDQRGSAVKFSAQYNPKRIAIGNTNLGELDAKVSGRYVQRQFLPLDRIDEIEFKRKWDLSVASRADELIQEASLTYRPLAALSLGGSYGLMERTGGFRSRRKMLQSSLTDSSLPRGIYEIEHIQSANDETSDESEWLRQRGTLEFDVWRLRPGIRVEMEQREQHPMNGDSLFRGSFRLVEVSPRLAFEPGGPLSATAEAQIRTEDSASVGNLRRASRSFTQIYSWWLRDWHSLSSTLSLSIRKTRFTDEFRTRGNVDVNSTLLRFQSRYAPGRRALDLDVLYEFSNERSAQLERVFIRAPKGTGNYKYLGDLNGNTIADEAEFEQTRFDGDYVVFYLPGDELVPVVDLKAGFRARFRPSTLVPKPSSVLEHLLASLSTETVGRIDERSTESESRQIYLLNFARFQNPATTISGSSLFTQDIHLFESDPGLSFRFRYSQRRSLIRFVSAAERGYQRERSVRIRSQLLREIGNQTEFTNKLDQVAATTTSPRERDLLSNQLRTEFSYRPKPVWEIALGIGVSRTTHRFEGRQVTADVNEQSLRLTYAFQGVGQLRTEVSREEASVPLAAGEVLQPFPYEFTNGRVVGKTFLWQLALDYRFNQYVQVTVGYNGRTEGGRRPVHTARAEARAFF